VVSSLRVEGEGWDDIAEQASKGWGMTLQVLRCYATHFAGQPTVAIDLIKPVERADLTNLPVDGVIEHRGPSFTLLRTTTGMFAVSCFSMDAVTLSVNVTGRLYGPDAHARAAAERRRWQDWLTRL